MHNNENDTPLDLVFDYVQNAGEFIQNLFDKNVTKESGNDTNSFLKSINFKYSILNPRSGGSKGEIKVSFKRTLTYCETPCTKKCVNLGVKFCSC